ncbi:hypothetical protein [Gimesia algae]|uniref:Uncharacterized protein n=1 Tax=Gimesia algae TaxID=2527971 RepID=A0A517V6W9_9PLAN|nr:hypothetical protein [Gimesia algae]QDT88745.1 hypothetical protein Pan161_03630 [Gimesia algae]
MKKEEFAYIGCRLLALFYGVKVLFDLIPFVTMWISWKTNLVPFSQAPEGMIYLQMVYVQLIPLGLNLILACTLWFAANQIVKFILSGDFAVDGGSLTARQVQTVAFAAVGVLILGFTLPDIGATLFRIVEEKKFDNSAPITLDLKVQILLLGLRMLIGMFLMIGSNGLSELLTRLRSPKLT